jgi:vacuolar-type H+-ATPase subunit H
MTNTAPENAVKDGMSELLLAIKDAEAKAAQIVADARAKAEKIAADANAEIEKINADAQDKAAKATLVKSVAAGVQDMKIEPVSISKDRIEKAKKYIVDEFKKRYGA